MKGTTKMDEESDEIHYLNEAIKECTSLSNSIEATIDYVQKLSLKYNKNYDFPFNPSDDKQYNSIIIPADVAASGRCRVVGGESEEKTDDSLCNLSDDISFTDDLSNESGTSTPASRNSSSRLSLKSIKLYRTPSDIVQSQNDIRVKMIKIRRAFEGVCTLFEHIKQKYGVAKNEDYFFAARATTTVRRTSPASRNNRGFLYEKHLQRLQRIFMDKY